MYAGRVEVGVICWIDAAAGASGDMFLGALTDAGVPLEVLQAAVDALGTEPVRLRATETTRHGLAAIKVDVDCPPSSVDRRYTAIVRLITAADLPQPVKDTAVAAFTRLGRAEAAAHRVPLEQVHFHEVGALDSLADVVASCAGLHWLATNRGVTTIVSSPVTAGGGVTRGAHGGIPLPAPATLAVLAEAKAPVAGEVPYEACTPTGAAIIAAHASGYGLMPLLTVSGIGVGAGGRDPKERANVLRLVLGETVTPRPSIAPGPRRSHTHGHAHEPDHHGHIHPDAPEPAHGQHVPAPQDAARPTHDHRAATTQQNGHAAHTHTHEDASVRPHGRHAHKDEHTHSHAPGDHGHSHGEAAAHAHSRGEAVADAHAPRDRGRPRGEAAVPAHVRDEPSEPPGSHDVDHPHAAEADHANDLPHAAADHVTDLPRAIVLEANIDDLDPRLWPQVLAALLAVGASDAWLSPILMKKGRPAHTLHVLCRRDAMAEVRSAIFAHTSTIGLRVVEVGKHALEREYDSVEVDGQSIGVKLARDAGRVVNVSVEHADVVAAAAALGRPVKVVLARAVGRAAEKYGDE